MTIPDLPLTDQITIVVAMSEREETLRRMARSRKFAGTNQAATAQRAVLRSEARDCERIGSLLAATWGLMWERFTPGDYPYCRHSGPPHRHDSDGNPSF